MARRIRKAMLNSAISLFLLLFVYGCVFSGYVSEEQEIMDGKEKSYIVIRAVEQYKLDNGHCPEAIEDLIPKYLIEVPTTLTGYQIEYNRDREFFIVSFALRKRSKLPEGCGYHRYLDAWECSYGTE